jgi:hypothetical protein
VPGIFAHVFVDKVPALLARKSREPRNAHLTQGPIHLYSRPRTAWSSPIRPATSRVGSFG